MNSLIKTLDIFAGTARPPLDETGKALQAALLAVSLPNPYERNAGKPGRGLQRLARLIERRASRSGEYIKCLYE